MKEDPKRPGTDSPGYTVTKPDILAEVERGDEAAAEMGQHREHQDHRSQAEPAGTSQGDWLLKEVKSEDGASPPPGSPQSHHNHPGDLPIPLWEQGCSCCGIPELEPNPGAVNRGFTESRHCQPGDCTECGRGLAPKPDLVRHRLARGGDRGHGCGRCGMGSTSACASRCLGPPSTSSLAPPPRKERKELSLPEKVRVLEMLEGPKVSQNELAKRFGVSQPQICRIIKNKERILSEWHRNGHPERKRKREGQDAAALEAALLRWVEGAHASDLSASGGHLSKALGQPDPDSDPGWLSRFETRCNPPFKKPPAANGNAEQPPAERWAGTVLPGLLRCYAPAEIYGCGETDTVLPAGSDGSTRLTLLLCANADGSEKIPLRVVGENPWPRCLQGVNLPQMPWSYRAEGSAAEGMSATLFAEWLRDLDEGMRQRRKSVVLLLAEHEAHPYVRLTNVRLVFVPPSATLAQPLACGVTGDLKGHYRRRLLRWVPPERGREQPTLLDALHMLAQAWGDVRPGLIASCFRAAGFSPDVGTEALSREQPERRVLTEWDPEHDRELAEMDEGTAGHEGTGELAVRPCPSQREVWSSLATLRRYLECRVTSPHLFQAFYELEDVVHTVAAASGQSLTRDTVPKL